MKRIVGFTVILIASVVLSSCYIMSAGNTGSVSITVPAATASRTVSNSGGTSVGNTIRVYLYTYAANDETHYSLYSFPGGKSYKDFPNSADQTTTITLDNIPSGLWQVLVSTGSVDSPNGFMKVQYYGSSDVFNLSPGTVNHLPSFSIVSTPFTINPDLVGKDVVSVRQLNSNLYAATSSILYRGTASLPSAIAGASSMTKDPKSDTITATGSNAIESLSNGYTYSSVSPMPASLFVNTAQKGIVPYDGTNPDTSFSTNLVSQTGSLSDLTSGAFTLSGTTPGLVIFYQRDGGLGGAYLDSTATPTEADWTDFSTAEIVSGQPVYSFIMSENSSGENYAYVATKLGAFRLSSQSFNNTSSSSDILDYGKSFSAAKNVVIQCLAIDTSDPANKKLYMGTNNGVWVAPLQETNTDNPIGTSTEVAGTAGDSFTKIAINSSGDIAMRSRYNLYVTDTTGKKVSYPFFSGLPGELSSMVWGGTNKKTLYVAGSDGLVAINVAN